MRDRILAGVALFVLATSCAHAAVPAEELRTERARIDRAISARNALLDRIRFEGHDDDSVHLASINGSELTVEYARRQRAPLTHESKNYGVDISTLARLIEEGEI